MTEARIREATPDFEPTDRQRTMFDMMSWDDVAGLDPCLITIGSHTLTHPILTTLDPEALERELVDSRRRLEERLGREAAIFCYPNGSSDALVRDHVKAHYRAAVTTVPGFVTRGADLYQLNRVSAEPRLSYFAWRMHRPLA